MGANIFFGIMVDSKLFELLTKQFTGDWDMYKFVISSPIQFYCFKFFQISNVVIDHVHWTVFFPQFQNILVHYNTVAVVSIGKIGEKRRMVEVWRIGPS